MLPPKQESILTALAEFKFLTRLQLARLGIEKYNSSFTRHCKPLHDAKYIGAIDAVRYGLGHIYYLTKKGADWVSKQQDLELHQINFCINKSGLSLQSLFHRTYAIDCQIELYQSCTTENIIFYDRDIETLGDVKRNNNLARKTRIPLSGKKQLEPDAIFMLDTHKGKKLYCLEYEHKDFTKKSYQKILMHVEALNLKSPSKKYGHDKAHRTLFVYQNPATMEAVMKQLLIDVSGINSWFLFKTFDGVKSDGQFKNSIYELPKKKNFMTGWQLPNGERIVLY